VRGGEGARRDGPKPAGECVLPSRIAPTKGSIAALAYRRVSHRFLSPLTTRLLSSQLAQKTGMGVVANGGKVPLPMPRADGPVVGAPGPRPGGANVMAAPGAPGMAPVGRAPQPAALPQPSVG
jgi:hypothetical protein